MKKLLVACGLLALAVPLTAQETMQVPFSAQCTHPYYGDLSADVNWSSDLMGYLFTGQEGPDAPVDCDPTDPSKGQCGSFALIQGQHVIRATCTAPNGLEDYAEVTITVDPTQSPAAVFNYPENGATFDKEP